MHKWVVKKHNPIYTRSLLSDGFSLVHFEIKILFTLANTNDAKVMIFLEKFLF